jgi:hypothetical protein
MRIHGRVVALGPYGTLIVAAGFIKTNVMEAAHPLCTIREMLTDYRRINWHK